jgi:hypothetical protein
MRSSAQLFNDSKLPRYEIPRGRNVWITSLPFATTTSDTIKNSCLSQRSRPIIIYILYHPQFALNRYGQSVRPADSRYRDHPEAESPAKTRAKMYGYQELWDRSLAMRTPKFSVLVPAESLLQQSFVYSA